MANGIKGFCIEKWMHPKEDYFRVANLGESQSAGIIIEKDQNDRGLSANEEKSNMEFLCNEFICSIKRADVPKSIKKINTVLKSNNIMAYNHSRDYPQISKEDYLAAEFPGYSAIGLKVDDEILTYGLIGDCGLALFDSNGKMRFKTRKNGFSSRRELITFRKLAEKFNPTPNFLKTVRDIREVHRNNSDSLCSYGTLTGQDEAMKYLKEGSIDMRDNFAVLYTQSLEGLIYNRDFVNLATLNKFEDIRKLCQSKIKTSGSLIYIH